MIVVMELHEFKIGASFWTYTDEWRCTDVGTRVAVGVKLGPVDEEHGAAARFGGPPYEVEEVVWDEYEREICFPTKDAMLVDRERNENDERTDDRRNCDIKKRCSRGLDEWRYKSASCADGDAPPAQHASASRGGDR